MCVQYVFKRYMRYCRRRRDSLLAYFQGDFTVAPATPSTTLGYAWTTVTGNNSPHKSIDHLRASPAVWKTIDVSHKTGSDNVLVVAISVVVKGCSIVHRKSPLPIIRL